MQAPRARIRLNVRARLYFLNNTVMHSSKKIHNIIEIKKKKIQY